MNIRNFYLLFVILFAGITYAGESPKKVNIQESTRDEIVRLLAETQNLLNNKQDIQALGLCKKALTIAENSSDHILAGFIYFSIAQIYDRASECKDIEQAKIFYQKVIAVYENSKEESLKEVAAESYCALGSIQNDELGIRDITVIFEYLKKAVNLYSDSHPRKSKVQAVLLDVAMGVSMDDAVKYAREYENSLYPGVRMLAYIVLGHGHRYGNGGLEQNMKTSLQYFQKATSIDIPDTMQQEVKSFVAFTKMRAEQEIAYCYLMGGNGVEKNHEKAFELYTKIIKADPSATNTHTRAHYGLGKIYRTKNSAYFDLNKSRYHYELASQDMHDEWQMMGTLYGLTMLKLKQLQEETDQSDLIALDHSIMGMYAALSQNTSYPEIAKKAINRYNQVRMAFIMTRMMFHQMKSEGIEVEGPWQEMFVKKELDVDPIEDSDIRNMHIFWKEQFNKKKVWSQHYKDAYEKSNPIQLGKSVRNSLEEISLQKNQSTEE